MLSFIFVWLPNRKAVKKVGSHEKRIVNHELHKISRAIVQDAYKTNSAIVLGWHSRRAISDVLSKNYGTVSECVEALQRKALLRKISAVALVAQECYSAKSNPNPFYVLKSDPLADFLKKCEDAAAFLAGKIADINRAFERIDRILGA